jgi:hypothetical protein
LTLVNSTVSGNVAVGAGQYSYVGGHGRGAGIYCSGSLTVSGSSIATNSATGGDGVHPGAAAGGGIYCSGTLAINSSTLSANSVMGGTEEGGAGTIDGGDGSGGGIYDSGKLTANGITVAGNSATGGYNFDGTGGTARGGGIYGAGGAALSNNTISNNLAAGGNEQYQGDSGSQVGGSAFGGGVYGTGSALSISQCTILHNTATGGVSAGYAWGGGVYSTVGASISASSITSNTAGGGEDGGWGSGGGVASEASLSISISTISGNTAAGANWSPFYYASGGTGQGGGIRSDGSLTVTASTISGNHATGGTGPSDVNLPIRDGGAADGGGIYATDGASLTNSTIAQNTASGGAGLPSISGDFAAGAGGDASGGSIFESAGSLNLVDSTVSANISIGGSGGAGSGSFPNGPRGSSTGGGITVVTGSSAVLTNSIVSADKAAGSFNDISGAVTIASSKFNLIGVGGGLINGMNGNKVGVTNPKLSALGTNGGPTKTMVPLAGSSAIDAGSNALVPSGVTKDQRGFARISGASVDIGAVEYGNGVISGTVYNDVNGDGVHQSGELPMSGWQLYIDLNSDAKLDAGDPTATTDANGNYKFTGLTAGTYVLFEVVKPNYRVSMPTGAAYTVTLKAGGSATGRLFENTLKALIGGTVFNDANGNKIKDSTEQGLSGWRVYIDTNNDGVWESTEPSVLTDSNGNWAFTDLAPGTYVIRIVQHSGFARTTPSSGSFTIKAGLGGYNSGYLFGEKHS